MCSPIKAPAETLQLRNALGCFPTGVAVVTALKSEGAPIGMTINSFTSVSLNPPLVAWCIDRSAASYRWFAATPAFTVTVLAESQQDLAWRFARRGEDKFRDLPVPADAEPPVIPGGCAWFRCVTHRTVLLGDHRLLVGEVQQFQCTDARPLVFSRGDFHKLPIASASAAA